MDYHILGGDDLGNQYSVAHHVSIPDANNQVSVNYRTALVQYLTQDGGTITSRVPFIGGVELAQLQIGELVEWLEGYDTDPTEDLATKRDDLDARFIEVEPMVRGLWQRRLDYWGFERDVP